MTEPDPNKADEDEDEGDYGDGEDGDDSILSVEETYFPQGKGGFCDSVGAVALQEYEGGIFVYMVGKGRVELGDLLKNMGKPKLASVK